MTVNVASWKWVPVTVTTSSYTGTIDDGFCYVVYAAPIGDIPFPYPLPIPTVTSLSPLSGTTAGGTSLTVYGTDFTQTARVLIGGIEASEVVVTSAGMLTCTTPAFVEGEAIVLVRNS